MAEEAAPVETPAADAAPVADPAPAAEQTLLGDAKPEGEEAKPEGDKPDEAKDEDKKPEGAPEAYEAFKAPEGMTLDETAIAAFQPIAKDLNLTQDQAQKLVDLFAAERQREAEASVESVKAMRTGWVEAAKSDKEFGGVKFDESLGSAKKALEAFGTPALVSLLNETGFGDNPEVIRFFARVGKSAAEDKSIPAKAPSASRDAAATLYPSK